MDIVKALLESDKIDVSIENIYGDAPLHTSVTFKRSNILKTLLESDKIDVNLQDSDGKTALHKAIENDSIDMLDMLLKSNKIDVNLKDNYNGKTPLHLAAQEGNIDLVDALLESDKINVNLKDNSGKIPLYYAVKNGHGSSVGLLLIDAMNKSKVVGEKKDEVGGNNLDLDDDGWHAEYRQNTDTELTMMEKHIESEYLI